MNWNSTEFIWLDWLVLTVGVIAIVWAVYRAIKKDQEKMKGADSQDYLFGKGEPRIGRYRCKRRCGNGTLGNARMDDPYFRMVVRSFLSVIKQQNGQDYHYA